jgi:Flp pilus assembly protein TadG
MKNFLRLLRNSSGNVTVLFGLSAFALMGGAGVAIDMVRINQARSVLQNAVDSAATAGATAKDKSDANLAKIVDDFLLKNQAIATLEKVTLKEQKLDPSAGTFSVSISGTIPGSFMKLFGFADVPVNAISVASTGSQSLELALVLDNTGSMAGSKIDNLKSAATKLVSILEGETSDFADVKIAVVPFAQYVNVGTGNLGQSWLDKKFLGGATWEGCVGSRLSPYDEDISLDGGNHPALAGVACNLPILPLTTDFDAVKSTIGAMSADGDTYIPAGLMWGWNVLDSAEPFTEGKTKAETKRMNGQKAIVLMTDGENTLSVSAPFHYKSDGVTANKTLADSCAAAKKADIAIYTVSFMVKTNTVKGILRDCANSPQQFFDAADSAELTKAFTQIARELAAVRLTQ